MQSFQKVLFSTEVKQFMMSHNQITGDKIETLIH